jgi:hypothetical protein
MDAISEAEEKDSESSHSLSGQSEQETQRETLEKTIKDKIK